MLTRYGAISWLCFGRSDMSVCVHVNDSPSDAQLPAARAAMRRARTLRHPALLRCHDAVEVEKGVSGRDPGPVVYVVTEPCQPLQPALAELDREGLRGREREEYLAFGLRQVAEAVSFLNNDCKMSHCAVSAAAIAVTPSLDFRLHAFDFLDAWWAKKGDPAPPSEGVRAAGAACAPHTQLVCQELANGDWDVLRNAPPWSIDAWGLGVAMQEVFRGGELRAVEQLREMQAIPRALAPAYQRLLSSTPARRLNPKKLLEQCDFFSNALTDFLGFLDNLALKDGADKESFFRRMPAALDAISPVISRRKVLPLLAKALEFGGAPASGLGAMLKIGAGLSPEEFASQILPVMVRLFSSNDRAVRISLLQNMDAIGPHLTPELIEAQVYKDLEKGFADTSAFLRELTLKSLPMLAPKMKQATLNSSALKHLAKLQVDEEPAIRTNTTICLGNIARHLGDASRKRVLINAFGRALKDTFAPARAAGLMALSATMVYYTCQELAQRVMPSASVLLVDGDEAVRAKAFACVDAAMARLRERDEDVRAGREERAGADTTGDTQGGTMSSLLGWAASAAVAAGASPAKPPKPAVASQPRDVRPPASDSRPAAAAPAAAPAARPTPALGQDGPQLAADGPEDAEDGWGSDDDLNLSLDPMSIVGNNNANSSKGGGGTGTTAADMAADQDDDDGWADMDDALPKPVIRPSAVPRPRPAASGKKARTSLKLGAKKLAAD